MRLAVLLLCQQITVAAVDGLRVSGYLVRQELEGDESVESRALGHVHHAHPVARPPPNSARLLLSDRMKSLTVPQKTRLRGVASRIESAMRTESAGHLLAPVPTL
jgi:hypothetical protein